MKTHKKITAAWDCLRQVDVAINHVRDLAPDCPLERFLAQEIANAKAEAFEQAGWYLAAKRWREAAEDLGELPVVSRIAIREVKHAG